MNGSARSTVEVPILETERLKLRGHRRADFTDCAAMWRDATVTRYIGGKPFSREEVWARLLRYVGHWAWLGFGYWAVEEKATSELVGELGFADFKRDIKPSLEDTPELGWVLASRAHGRGYATEAVRAALTWADEHFGNARTVCIIHPENLASVRVAEKCGYREFQRTTYKGHDIILFER
ncbi:MAG: GNAT family N-acetyltransferase [Candidatus Korobacteraceae bacterium]